MPLTAADATDLFRSEPDRFVAVDGGRGGEVAVRTVGAGPDVVFVHGWPVSGATFRCLLPFLVDHVTCHLLDLPGAGSSRVDAGSTLTIANHVAAVRAAIDDLGADSVALVGHDSGGMIARHAIDGDDRLRGLGLINTEPPEPGWRFRSFLASSRLPGFGAILGWAAGHPRVRRNKFVLGDAFADRSNLDGEFDEFFLRPLHDDAEYRAAQIRLIHSFERRFLTELAGIHSRIAAPVRLVWGDQDPFFPVEQARRMVSSFPDASLVEIRGAGLFCHEESPERVAEALLPVLVAT